MARSPTSKERPLHWVGSSKKDLLAFPSDVVDDFGYALSVVQHGSTPPSAKAWKGEGSGVFELVEEHRGDAFRAVYTVRFEKAIYVLHCFQKKSTSGVQTPRQDVRLIHARLRTAQSDYEVRYGRKED
jgi:phage-related protein